MFLGINYQGKQFGWYFGFVLFLVYYNVFIYLGECEKKMFLYVKCKILNVVYIVSIFFYLKKIILQYKRGKYFIYFNFWGESGYNICKIFG